MVACARKHMSLREVSDFVMLEQYVVISGPTDRAAKEEGAKASRHVATKVHAATPWPIAGAGAVAGA